MADDQRWAAAVDLLGARGADEMAHPGGTLLAHLIRVGELLGDWGAGDDLRLAGLCHAAYGTDGFDEALVELGERPTLTAAIGRRAEELVYAYGSCDRSVVYPQLGRTSSVEFADRFTGERRLAERAEVDALVEMTAANEFDVLQHNPELAQRYAGPLIRSLDRASDHLSAPARQVLASWRLSIPVR